MTDEVAMARKTTLRSRAALGARLGVFGIWIPVLFLLTGCSSAGSSRLYESTPDGGTRLKDSEIRLETYTSLKRGAKPDLRTLVARDGVVRGTVETATRQGTAEVPADAYVSLWNRLIDAQALTLLEVEPPDTTGGLYHVVRLTLGGDTGEFSGQIKTNFMGFQTESIKKRLELVNDVAKLFGKHVPSTEKPKPSGSRP